MLTAMSGDGTAVAYERTGDGPPAVAGASGGRDTFADLAARLAGRFTAVTCDRRRDPTPRGRARARGPDPGGRRQRLRLRHVLGRGPRSARHRLDGARPLPEGHLATMRELTGSERRGEAVAIS